MEAKKPGNKSLPDFKQLSDRIVAPHPTGPSLVIKTNLDPKDVTEENPYYDGGVKSEKFKDYFDNK